MLSCRLNGFRGVSCASSSRLQTEAASSMTGIRPHAFLPLATTAKVTRHMREPVSDRDWQMSAPDHAVQQRRVRARKGGLLSNCSVSTGYNGKKKRRSEKRGKGLSACHLSHLMLNEQNDIFHRFLPVHLERQRSGVASAQEDVVWSRNKDPDTLPAWIVYIYTYPLSLPTEKESISVQSGLESATLLLYSLLLLYHSVSS